MKEKSYWYTAGLLVVLLLVKFATPLFIFDVPLGYDVGMYRYLFLQYADSIQSFTFPPQLLPWAKEYPMGLFILISPFIALGVPVDAVIGWMWNLVPVLLTVTLACVTGKRLGKHIGMLVLLVAILSAPLYDGFVGMYYKAFVSLLFGVLSFHYAEKRSYVFILFALVSMLIHQQTGLVIGLSFVLWWLMRIPQLSSDIWFRRITILGGIACICGIVMYLPQWERAIWYPLKSLFVLRGDAAPSGSFPDTAFYLQTSGVVLLLGCIGFLQSFRRERSSLWQMSVLVCLVCIVFRLVFYKRFFLQLDFFLLPYAASTIYWLWRQMHSIALRVALVVLLCGQAWVGIQVMHLRTPHIQARDLQQIQEVAKNIPEHASVIALENISGPFIRGWRETGKVGAPGLFDYPNWSIGQWGAFIDGASDDRKALLGGLSGEIYFMITPAFTGFYGDRSHVLFNDPCLEKVTDLPLLRSTCSL